MFQTLLTTTNSVDTEEKKTKTQGRGRGFDYQGDQEHRRVQAGPRHLQLSNSCVCHYLSSPWKKRTTKTTNYVFIYYLKKKKHR